jgi:TatD DNase family protein
MRWGTIITQESYQQKVQGSCITQYLENKEHMCSPRGDGSWRSFSRMGEKHLDLTERQIFALQCDLAQELNLPIMVHSRDNFAQTRDILKNYKEQTIYFHCRGYGPEEYKQLRDTISNLYIGFCGNISYKKVDNLLETLKIVAFNQLVLETDAPYLTPQVVRWQTNEPAYVKYIYDFVATFLSKEEQDLTIQIESNIKRLYNIK